MWILPSTLEQQNPPWKSMGVGLFSVAQTPPNSFSYPDGLGELLYGGDGDGVLPWLSKPAEVTRELLRKTETQLSEPGNQPSFPPTEHSNRAVSAQQLWGLSSCSHHMKLKMVRTRQVTDIPEKKANSGTSSLPSTRTPQSQTHSRLQWLDSFR